MYSTELYSYTFKNTCLCDMLFLELHITQFVSQNVDFSLLYLQPLTKLQQFETKIKGISNKTVLKNYKIWDYVL